MFSSMVTEPMASATMRPDVGFFMLVIEPRGVFESAVAVGAEGAVLEHQVVGIAERLLARDMAVYQPKVTRVPPQVLSVELRVVDGDVLNLPESILGSYARIAQLYVLHVLEHILALALQPVDGDVFAEHERIGPALQLKVLGIDALAPPEHLVGIGHLHVLDVNVVHLAKHLRGVYLGVCHLQVVRIPQCRTPADVEVTAVDGKPMYMPEGVVALKTAVGRNDVATLFYGRLTLTDGHIVDVQVV